MQHKKRNTHTHTYTHHSAQLSKMQKRASRVALGCCQQGSPVRPAVEQWGALSPPLSHSLCFYPSKYEARYKAQELVLSKWQPNTSVKALKCQSEENLKLPPLLAAQLSPASFQKWRLIPIPPPDLVPAMRKYS